MTDNDQQPPQGAPDPEAKVEPETLELRARPQPVTRINRKVVIGGAAILLCLIAFVVLLALGPPSLNVADRRELFNVENKPVTDALSKLPASYAGVQARKKTEAPGKQASVKPPAVPTLVNPQTDLITDAERMEKARLARLAGQARESGVFFRLKLKPPPKETAAPQVRADPAPPPSPAASDAGAQHSPLCTPPTGHYSATIWMRTARQSG